MEKHNAKKYANYCVERYIIQPIITNALFKYFFVVKWKKLYFLNIKKSVIIISQNNNCVFFLIVMQFISKFPILIALIHISREHERVVGHRFLGNAGNWMLCNWNRSVLKKSYSQTQGWTSIGKPFRYCLSSILL